MTENLLDPYLDRINSVELRIVLGKHFDSPGQYDGKSNDKLYLPLADASCRVVLKYKEGRIVEIKRGTAFDVAEWSRICVEIESSLLNGSQKIGRELTFSSHRVLKSWRGTRSGIQILPPPEDAPQPLVESAEHPFILEFPILASDIYDVTHHRRLHEHRNLTLLLNLLLVGRTNAQPLRSEYFWAAVSTDDNSYIRWVRRYYFANIGKGILDEASPCTEWLEEIESEKYYATIGYGELGLRVPSDLDDSICRYQQLLPDPRNKFNRAIFWMDIASRQWNVSVSASFAALVTAVESLTKRGTTHHVYCERCQAQTSHEAPAATEQFRTFFERYAPGASLKERRTKMYSLRSGILHGSYLMQLDQGLAPFGFPWEPPEQNESGLHDELWSLTQLAMRNWLKATSSLKVK